MEPLFANPGPVSVIVPDVAGRDDLLALILEESAELVVELGGPPVVGAAPATRGARLEFVIDPSATVPLLRSDREASTVEAVGASLDDAAAALSLLRTMRRTGTDRLEFEPATDPAGAIERVDAEIATTWPSFERTGIDWSDVSARLRPQPEDPDLIAGLQRWVAALGDGHTNVHPDSAVAALPYAARFEGDHVVLADVPVGTNAWRAGVRAGDRVEHVDRGSAHLVGAPAHLRPWVIGRRVLSGSVGVVGEWHARRPDGTLVSFCDEPGAASWPEPIEWRRLRSGTGYLRVRRWTTTDAPMIDSALTDLAGFERMLVDLRGNAGGQLVAATAFRRRFLTRPTRIGSVRFSIGDGTLSPPSHYDDEPSDRVRRPGRTRFLTDPLTYSASEDAILGLNQFDRIDFVGEPTGGGSGRPRTIPLIGTAVLTISTALTYDHAGRCIEGVGIRPNRAFATTGIPIDGDAIEIADTAW